MNKRLVAVATVLLTLLFLFCLIQKVESSAIPSVQWSGFFGGPKTERAYSLIQTADGGYASAGSTNTFGAGQSDFWLIKTDSLGNMLWNKTFGGPNDDVAGALIQADDGGYLIAGLTASFGAGGFDFWLVKTDSFGNMQWNKTYGGAKDDFATSVIKTSGGDYAVAGWTNSFGAGGEDLWLLKTDSSGNMIWNQTYGGPFNDEAHALTETNDGGYAIAGDTAFQSGNEDSWLVKADSRGNMQWNQTYGGPQIDTALSIVGMNDGSYVLAGYTSSFGAGLNDAWLIKTDASGTLQWNKTYGGSYDDQAYAMVQSSGGGFALAGQIRTSANGTTNYWLLETDSSGNMKWNKTNDGSLDNSAYALVQAEDGGFALAGFANTQGNAEDVLLVKINGNGGAAELPLLPVISLIIVILVIVLAVILYFARKSKVPLKTRQSPLSLDD